MRTPAEIWKDRLAAISTETPDDLLALGQTIQEMFKEKKLTRLWIDSITNEVCAA
jgi:hypothetical protein